MAICCSKPESELRSSTPPENRAPRTIPFHDLAAGIAGEVHTDILRRWMLSTDASYFQRMPAAVVYPRSSADVSATVLFAAAHGLSVHPRGAGSGLCGSALGGGVVIDFSKYMNRLLHLDKAGGWFACEPGYRFGELEAELKGSGLFFPPDPSSGEYATFGGMCATNASGAHSVKYGNVADYLLDADLVRADGRLVRLSELAALPPERLPDDLRALAALYEGNAAAIESDYPPIACNVAGYNLRGLVREGRLHLHRLLCGAEGTLGVATRLTFRLAPKPPADSLVVAYFDDITAAARAAQLAVDMQPSGIEIMDKSLLQMARDGDPSLRSRIPADVDNVLLIEFDGPSAEACAAPAEAVLSQLRGRGLTRRAYLAVSSTEKEKFWALRKAAVPILYKLKGRRKILALVEDAAIPVAQLVPYFKGVYEIFGRLRVDFVLYGHIAKGLMHTRPLLDLKDPADVALLKPIADAVYDLVSGLGGTVSGEHGDGRLRSGYLQRRYPRLYDLFRRTKALLDPAGLFNPEIKTGGDAQQMTRSLRYGAGYRAAPLPAEFLRWRPDFIGEVERCHGCSKCTTVTAATRMCPVFKATRDEGASPKAKANVLRALISGAIPSGELAGKALQAVMSTCINCGSCYLECPSNVNIPKLAMEAKAHYLRRRGASMLDTLTAGVEEAARMPRPAAALAELLSRPGPAACLAARLAGLAPERGMVAFARRPLDRRVPSLVPGGSPRVLFYAGCYAAYIRPELGQAAVEVLAAMGMQVHLPPQHCCGLPHLSKGMAAAARRKVAANLSAWGRLLPHIDYIAVTCSSCGYALMQDWSYLSDDPAIGRIRAKIIHISRLVGRYRRRLDLVEPAPLGLAYHMPCHLRLQPDSRSSADLLGGIAGVQLKELQSRCCGMAGSWGLAARNYTLSKAIAAPMIAELKSTQAAVGVTDCPTCEMQMAHLGSLPVRHPIEVVRDACRRPQAKVRSGAV